MKKIILMILLSFCLLMTAEAQWIVQNSGTTTEILSVCFINRNTGWVCGNGIILKTINSGTNWEHQTHPTTNKRLECIFAIDSNIVFCVGQYETILKSTNGGTLWVPIRNGPAGMSYTYYSTYFINSNTGWITGGGQYILKTTNGGITLDSIYQFLGLTRDIYFNNMNTGILCGNGGTLKKTTDGGYNLYTPNINLHGNLYDFRDISFVNNQYGWIIGQQANGVYRTSDFGQNWDSVGNVIEGYEVYSVFFSSINTGWCGSGGIGGGRLFKSTNSGYSWSRQLGFPIPGFVADIYFYNDSIGWAVGSNGMILYTTTGGVTFVKQLSYEIPNSFTLYQNYPNPFNNTTLINFDIKEKDVYIMHIFDVNGRKIDEVFREEKTPGSYQIKYYGDGLSSGIYFYKLKSSRNSQSKKFILIK
jgi:photosystem II stability/assembly factor-like uncharacterized protein